ncbi:hypothetical protein ACFQT0_06865 [Hymenobacter humi]|uniref:HD domain-containing protein n=1 Tax=Hymenobacter humi TaxID=1411620 RepID=A0ABW2U2J6_9BACT
MESQAAEDFIVDELRRSLSPTLYYHGLHHTLDVKAVAMELAYAEGVTDTESLVLLRTAALYHDAGFLHTYQGHEARGCEPGARHLAQLRVFAGAGRTDLRHDNGHSLPAGAPEPPRPDSLRRRPRLPGPARF